MAKKTVILTPQERFDLIDALALQQGSIDYVGQVIGNLMGASSGLLSFASFEANGDTISMGSKRFAFYVSSGSLIESNGQLQPAASQDRVGEVVVYDPSAPQQQIQQLDFSTAKAAYDAHAAQQVDRGIDLNTGVQLIFDPTATPFIWARGIPVSGQEDARRKWSIAQQVEVPVTMKTRVLTQVEFALSPTMPSPTHTRSEDLGGAEVYIPWAPIARIIDFEGNLPVITPISAFDSAAWEERLKDKYDLDPRNGSTFIDWYSGEIPSLTSKEFFGDYQRPMGPAVSPMVSLITRLGLSQNVDLLGHDFPLTDQLKLLSDVLGNRPNDESSLDGLRHLGHNFTKDNSFSCWNKSKVDGSVGIADQLAGIKAVIQAITSSGLYEYGGDIVLDKRVAPFKNDDEDLRNLWTALAENKKSGWNAKPIRSLNSLALENMIQKEELESLRKEIDALRQDHDTLREEHDNLQTDFDDQDDPFSSVPINDAQPLVPALSAVFDAKYYTGGSGNFSFMTVRHGPSDTGAVFKFFVKANAYSQVSYARGGLRVTLPESFLNSFEGDLEDCLILATPTHKERYAPWLLPGEHRILSGRVEAGGSTNIGGQPPFNQAQGYNHPRHGVLNAFANFYQCTLNVVIHSRDATHNIQNIDIYPVSSVPDIVNKGHDLRGYPNYGKWIEEVGGLAPEGGDNDKYFNDIQGTWRDGFILDNSQTSENFTYSISEVNDPDKDDTTEEFLQDTVGGTVFSYLHGDSTDPRLFRKEVSNSEFAKDEIFGHKDDLRGYCHDLTFLRPDRLSFTESGGEFKLGGDLAGIEHIENYPMNYNNNDGDEFRVGEGGGRIPEPNALTVTCNGKFMPSFSLVIYKPTYASLGNPEPVKQFTANDVSINYNSSNVPNENGVVIRTGDTSTRGGE